MDAVRQVFSVLIVFLLLGAALWTLRRRGATPGKGRLIEQVEKLALTPQHALHLIRVEGGEIVVATHPQGCTLIHRTVTGSVPMGRGAEREAGV